MKRKKKPVLAIIGAGGLARTVARTLDFKRLPAVVAARRPGQARAIARELRLITAMSLEDAVGAARTVLLAVPDATIATVAKSLAPARPSWRGVVVLHAAGALGPEPLKSLARRGAATGVLHPLAALDRSGFANLSGMGARIEGSPRAVIGAKRLAARLGLVPLRGKSLATPSGRRRYHAAASLASNDVLALLVAARDLLVRSGVGKTEATSALLSLAMRAIGQARIRDLAGALTGPVVRGDVATVEAHLAAMAIADPLAAEAHRALSLRLAAFAVAEGRLDPAAARRIRAALARGRRRALTV